MGEVFPRHRPDHGQERAATNTLYLLGLLALLLTAAGLHGITSALFARRNREFAIRLVMRAAPRHIMGTVVLNALKLASIGLVLGLAIALPAAIVLGSKVEGIAQRSLAAVGFSSVFVITAAVAAAAQPASRVLRIQPADVLRAE
jgi:ABC-type antimicrobial peptide transport system permease subunit